MVYNIADLSSKKITRSNLLSLYSVVAVTLYGVALCTKVLIELEHKTE
jgi:hypothetical protein